MLVELYSMYYIYICDYHCFETIPTRPHAWAINPELDFRSKLDEDPILLYFPTKAMVFFLNVTKQHTLKQPTWRCDHIAGKHIPIIYHVKTSTPLAVHPDYIPIFVGLFRYLLVNNGWYMVISCYIPHYGGPLGSRCHDLGWRTSIGGKARHLPRFVTAGRRVGDERWEELGFDLQNSSKIQRETENTQGFQRLSLDV